MPFLVDSGEVPRLRTMPKPSYQCSYWIVIALTTPIALLLSAPLKAQTWKAIDALRNKLTSSGVKVVQRDCARRGLQGSYHPKSDTLTVCRNHRNAAQVWNTLAHEATHRMQACSGGSITQPQHHSMMSRVLRREARQEWRSIMAYPRSQHLAELEARYTARLPAHDVLKLFDRYCGTTIRA